MCIFLKGVGKQLGRRKCLDIERENGIVGREENVQGGNDGEENVAQFFFSLECHLFIAIDKDARRCVGLLNVIIDPRSFFLISSYINNRLRSRNRCKERAKYILNFLRSVIIEKVVKEMPCSDCGGFFHLCVLLSSLYQQNAVPLRPAPLKRTSS